MTSSHARKWLKSLRAHTWIARITTKAAKKYLWSSMVATRIARMTSGTVGKYLWSSMKIATFYWNCLCTTSSSSLWRSRCSRACLALTLALECSCTPGRAKGCEVSPSLLT